MRGIEGTTQFYYTTTAITVTTIMITITIIYRPSLSPPRIIHLYHYLISSITLSLTLTLTDFSPLARSPPSISLWSLSSTSAARMAQAVLREDSKESEREIGEAKD